MNRYLSATLVAVLAVGVSWGAGETPGNDPVRSELYEVRHRPLADAAELLATILSDDGEIALSWRLKRLIVTDRSSVLDRVSSLLEDFDVPPRNVQITATLILGTDQREGQAGQRTTIGAVSKEIRGITETIGDFTKWNAFESLGARSITALEGSMVSADLADGYRVLLEVEAIDDSGAGSVKLKKVSLQRVYLTADGEERASALYSAAVSLPLGTPLQVGVAKNSDSEQALFLVLRAAPR